MKKSFRVIINENAESDILIIRAHIARDSPLAAHKWYLSLQRHIRSLSNLPERYEFIPEDESERIYRHIILGNYRVIYSIKDANVGVLRVVHAARILNLSWLRGISPPQSD